MQHVRGIQALQPRYWNLRRFSDAVALSLCCRCRRRCRWLLWSLVVVVVGRWSLVVVGGRWWSWSLVVVGVVALVIVRVVVVALVIVVVVGVVVVDCCCR